MRLLLFTIIAGANTLPFSDGLISRSARSAGYIGSGASAGASSSAISSASTSYSPGPGGSGSFDAKSDFGLSHQPYVPNYIQPTGTYAGNYGYGKNDYSNVIVPNNNYGGSGPATFSTGFNNGGGTPPGFNGGNGFTGSGFEGSSVGYREGGFSGAGGAGASSFAGSGAGGFSNFPFKPLDFSSFMQQYYANLAAQEEFFRKQAQAHGVDVPSNNIGGTNNAFGPQGGYGGYGGANAFPSNGVADRFGGNTGSSPSGGVGASAFGQIGPQGGFGAANVYPSDGVNNRFGGGDTGTSPNSGPVSSFIGQFPPPQGSFHGISSFSTSGQSDNNGKKTSYKQSSVSVNDNGKVKTFTAHDP